MKAKAEQSRPELLAMVARLSGTLSRMHGLLHLPGEDFADRWDACDRWCDQEAMKRLKPQKRRKFGEDDTDD